MGNDEVRVSLSSSRPSILTRENGMLAFQFQTVEGCLSPPREEEDDSQSKLETFQVMYQKCQNLRISDDLRRKE